MVERRASGRAFGAILRDWRAAEQRGEGTRERALDVLAALEGFAAGPVAGKEDRTAAFEALDTTSRKPFLSALGDAGPLERWAEAVFSLIRKTEFGLLDLFRLRLRADPSRALFQDMSAPVPLQWTYEQIDRRTRLIATAFHKLAADPAAGPRVAIFSENTVESAASDLACLFYDILDTPLNTHFNAEILAEIFDRLSIDIAVTDVRERVEVLERVRALTARPFKTVILDRAAAPESDPAVFLGEYCGRLSSAEVEETLGRRRRRPGNEVATVMFTSGSTGHAERRVLLDLPTRGQAIRARGRAARGRRGRGLPELPARSSTRSAGISRCWGRSIGAGRMFFPEIPRLKPCSRSCPGSIPRASSASRSAGPSSTSAVSSGSTPRARSGPRSRHPERRRPTAALGTVRGGIPRPEGLPFFRAERHRRWRAVSV